MLKNKLFMTSALIAVFVSGNSYASIGGSKTLARSVALALEKQNDTGFNIGSITIGAGIDETLGRGDVLNFDDAETKTQFIKMTDVQLPEKIDVATGDDISSRDSLMAGLALGVLNNKITDMGGQIKDGYLVAGDDGLVIDGKYGSMVAGLIDNNQDKLQQLAEGSSVITPERIKYIKSETENLGEVNRLKFNVDDFAMRGGNLTVKNGVTMNAGNVDVTDGKVNIAASDASNDINADVFNMTGGALNVEEGAKLAVVGNTMNVEFGADVVNNGDLVIGYKDAVMNSGLSGTGNLTIEKGAQMNIGDATIEQKSIVLDGNLIANLVAGQTKFVTEQFDGEGTLALVMKSAGEYNVFDGGVFAQSQTGIDTGSAVYDLVWSEDGTTVRATVKATEDIKTENNLSAGAATTVSGLVNSSSEKLNDLGVLVQERLVAGDSAAVEKAAKSLNPETESVHQSVASEIIGTVSNLASARMATPAFVGRNGGDNASLAGGVWAHGLYNKSKENNAFNAYTRGVAAGIDGTLNRVFTLGAGYAFNHSDVDLKSRDIEIDSHSVFAYGQYKPNAWYVNAVLSYTMSDYTEDANVLGIDLGADYKLDMYGASVMTGYDFAFGLTPEMGVRYMHVNGDTYTNSLGVKSKIEDADYTTGVLGAKYATNIVVGDVFTLRPELRAAALYDLTSDRFDSAVSMPGVDAYGVRANRLDRLGGQFGAGLAIDYKDVDLSLNYIIEVRKDYTSQTGMVRARYNF